MQTRGRFAMKLWKNPSGVQSNLIPIISVSSNNLCKYGILFHIYIKWYEEILKRWYLNPQKQFRSFVSPDHDSREKRPCIPLFQIAWVSMWKPSGHGFPSWKPVILYLCSLHGSGMSTKDWSNHPGCFFYDTGLACNLLGVHNKNSYFSHYLRGSLFESFIISELHKFIFNHKINGKVYFFRDSNGNEVDALLELPEGLKAIEIKAGKTIIPDFFKGLQYWNKITGLISSENYLVYGGNEYQKRSAVTVLGWKHLQTIFGKRNEGQQWAIFLGARAEPSLLELCRATTENAAKLN